MGYWRSCFSFLFVIPSFMNNKVVFFCYTLVIAYHFIIIICYCIHIILYIMVWNDARASHLRIHCKCINLLWIHPQGCAPLWSKDFPIFATVVLPVPRCRTTIPVLTFPYIKRPPPSCQHDADLISTGKCSMPGNTARGGIERQNNKQATHVSQY